MEFNLILFMPGVVGISLYQTRTTGLKFFFIQSLASIVTVIFLLAWMKEGAPSAALNLAAGALILKMGGFPFHQWLVIVGAEVS